MDSQNESILRFAKVACLGYIIDIIQLNLGKIIASEILIHSKQHKTYWTVETSSQVPQEAQMDMEITSKSSTDMRKIKAEYLKDHEEKRVKGTVSKAFPIDLTWRVHSTIRNQHTITIAPQV